MKVADLADMDVTTPHILVLWLRAKRLESTLSTQQAHARPFPTLILFFFLLHTNYMAHIAYTTIPARPSRQAGGHRTTSGDIHLFSVSFRVFCLSLFLYYLQIHVASPVLYQKMDRQIAST